ncbi:MAG: DUF4234 domain-containing protein [Candidatus Omnitrophica bacterium]|nr:DUF4234 domain-containing protein [Candidatus Omnitrophota bacterium]
MIILTLITWGIYFPIWFLRQKKAINNLNSKTKLGSKPFYFLLFVSIISVILIYPLILLEGKPTGNILDWADSLLNLVRGIIVIVMTFKVEGILRNHFKEEFSTLATFVLSIFYLQYKINRFLKTK